MAVPENEEVIEEVIPENNEKQEETPTPEDFNPDEITVEQAMAWRKEAAEEKARREKAEKLIVDQKKNLKKDKEKDPTPNNAVDIEEVVRKVRQEEKFYEANPDAEPYRDKINDYRGKWLSLEDSYLLASKADREVEQNRSIYWKGFVKWGAAWGESVPTVSIDTFDRMTEAEQNKYSADMTAKYWVIKFK